MINAIRNDEFIYSAQVKNTAADFMLEYLSLNNVDTIFGIPGGAVEPLFDAVARFNRNAPLRNRGDGVRSMRIITARHEAGAAFMADGYARETGRLGVCCATTGPGSTNLITGVASAYMDKVPMLVLTPQTSISNFGKQDFQDSSDDAISIVTMLSRCTRYNSMVSHIDQLEYKLMKAVKMAHTLPCGPAHLSIPMDIWNQEIGERDTAHTIGNLQLDGYDQGNYAALCQLITRNKKLLFLLGDDCLPYASDIVACAELLGADIITTPTAKGCIRANHPLYRGVLGFAGHKEAEDVLLDENVTHILAIGTSLDPFETAGLCDNAVIVKKMLYINHTVADGLVFQSAPLQLYGSIVKIFRDLRDYLIKWQVLDSHKQSYMSSPVDVNWFDKGNHYTSHCKDRFDYCSTTADKSLKNGPVKPQYLMTTLPKKLPLETRYHIDAGNSWAWATHYLHLNSVANYRVGMTFGSMGWAIGASVGAACAQDREPVVCITGDGSYLMSGQEITVAVQQQLSVVFIILNDRAFGMVKHGQRLGGGESIGFELPNVDFAMMARAVGARGITVRNSRELDALDIRALLDNSGPLLLDVHIDPEEEPPMASRLKDLGRA